MRKEEFLQGLTEALTNEIPPEIVREICDIMKIISVKRWEKGVQRMRSWKSLEVQD